MPQFIASLNSFMSRRPEICKALRGRRASSIVSKSKRIITYFTLPMMATWAAIASAATIKCHRPANHTGQQKLPCHHEIKHLKSRHYLAGGYKSAIIEATCDMKCDCLEALARHL